MKKGNAVVEEYVEKKRRKRRNWRTIKKERKKHFMYPEAPRHLLAAIDPITLKVVEMFDGIKEMEFATNRRNLQPILNRYFKGEFGKNGSPTVCDWIMVRFEAEEREELNMGCSQWETWL